MAKRIVIDTSILIDQLRGGLHWNKFFSGLEGGVELFLPTIVIYELFSGKSSKNRKQESKIEDFIKHFTKIELSAEIARLAGELFRDNDLNLDTSDYLIAASAIEIGAQIVTLDKKHFSKIPGVSIFPI
jgi:predicted nucleic acid-binding protein